jgi:molybdopterin converting factor small subunit
MKIFFYGDVTKQTNGEKSCEIKDCLNVRDLVYELSNHYGEPFGEFLLGEGTCFFLVNGKGLMMTGGTDTKLCPDDKIEILPFTEAG